MPCARKHTFTYGVNKEHSFGIVTNLKQCVSLKQEVPGNIRAQISGCFWASERFGYQLCPCICLSHMESTRSIHLESLQT